MKVAQVIKVAIIVLTFQYSAVAQEVKKSEEMKEKTFSIENCVNHFEQDKAVKTKVGFQYWFIDKDFIDGNTLKMSVVGPRLSTHPPHRHVEEEFFFVLEGTATFYLEGKTVTAGPYTSFYCPSNMEHGISNAGDTELKYLVMKKYQKK